MDIANSPVCREIVDSLLDAGELRWESHDETMDEGVLVAWDSMVEKFLSLFDASFEEITNAFTFILV